MMTLKETLIALVKEEEGLTTVEYAVAGALVAAAVVTAFTNLGDSVGDVITSLDTAICSGTPTPCN